MSSPPTVVAVQQPVEVLVSDDTTVDESAPNASDDSAVDWWSALPSLPAGTRWDEVYDDEEDDVAAVAKVGELIKQLAANEADPVEEVTKEVEVEEDVEVVKKPEVEQQRPSASSLDAELTTLDQIIAEELLEFLNEDER
jgi:hypothetical protein